MKKIGLSLAGGGVKGSYQVGAYYAFKKCHIKFNGIVGTSIGATNAASLASNQEYKLYKMWKTIDPGTLLGIDPEIVKAVNTNKITIKTFKGLLQTTKTITKNKGIKTQELKKIFSKIINIDKLYSNNIDFGLATYNFTKRKPTYIYKEDIPQNELIDYVMASCSLPIFKLDKNINNSIYLDGGFFDNCPTTMLLKKQYNLIYEVKINGIGVNKKIPKTNAKIITISPSRPNGAILEMNHRQIIDNIYMGYYDTLKKLNKYLGFKYTFHKPLFINYKRMLRKEQKSLVKYFKKHFKVQTDKEVILKTVEYIMEKEKYDYNEVYKLKQIINQIPYKNKLIYKFVKNLSI